MVIFLKFIISVRGGRCDYSPRVPKKRNYLQLMFNLFSLPTDKITTNSTMWHEWRHFFDGRDRLSLFR